LNTKTFIFSLVLGLLTLPATYLLAVLLLYDMAGSQRPQRIYSEIPFYIGHLVFWLNAWRLVAAKPSGWIWRGGSRPTLSSPSPIPLWRLWVSPLLFVVLFMAAGAFLTYRNSLVTAAREAEKRHNMAALRQLWEKPDILLPRSVKEAVVSNTMARSGDQELRWYLDHGLSPDALAPDVHIQTLLENACMIANVDAVKLLLSRGAHVNRWNGRASTPVFWVTRGDPDAGSGSVNVDRRLIILDLLAARALTSMPAIGPVRRCLQARTPGSCVP